MGPYQRARWYTSFFANVLSTFGLPRKTRRSHQTPFSFRGSPSPWGGNSILGNGQCSLRFVPSSQHHVRPESRFMAVGGFLSRPLGRPFVPTAKDVFLLIGPELPPYGGRAAIAPDTRLALWCRTSLLYVSKYKNHDASRKRKTEVSRAVYGGGASKLINGCACNYRMEISNSINFVVETPRQAETLPISQKL